MRLGSTLVLVVGLVLNGCSSSDGGAPAVDPALDPKVAQFGKTYGEWSAEWWRWIFELHDCDQHQINDPTGQHCALNQDPASPVFFLAGDSGGALVRDKCVIPAGKALFFPIVNWETDNAGVPAAERVSNDGLRKQAQAFTDSISTSALSVTLDGVSVADMGRFAIPTTQFTYEVPAEPNLYSCAGAPGITGVIDPAFSAGYYVMLAPPSKGAHTLRFAGRVPSSPNDFVLDVTYKFTIQ